MSNMSGKVAIVTGASSVQGIGAAIARRFASDGASLALVADAPEAGLKAVAQECRALAGEGATVRSEICDLARAGEAERTIERAVALFGRVDVLVNNAGVRARVKFGV